jgi:homoserine kinase
MSARTPRGRRPALWRATAPGSTSNLGPGFDCLGLALALPLTVTARRIPEGFSIVRRGEGRELAVDPHRDLVLRAFRHLIRLAGEPVPTVALTIDSAIPVARGLGSSAASIVAGLLLANEWLGGRAPLGTLLAEAVRLEGHPDNVAPSLLGGFVLSAPRREGGITPLPLPLPRGIAFTLVVPEIHVSTEEARALLPRAIPLGDAARNTARALALLCALLSGRSDLVADGLEDVYHVPYRARLIPGFDRVVRAGQRAGALGVTISGSGPTLLALHAPGRGARVGTAMVRAFARGRIPARAIPGRIDRRGARSRRLGQE